MTWVTVLVLGAIGAVLRAVVSERLPPLVGTASVNIAAAFVLGWSVSLDGVLGVGMRIGLLGALSTWSTLANQLADLARRRRWTVAACYLGTTLAAGVGAAWLGLQVSRYEFPCAELDDPVGDDAG